jgi:hypothetical protein
VDLSMALVLGVNIWFIYPLDVTPYYIFIHMVTSLLLKEQLMKRTRFIIAILFQVTLTFQGYHKP